MLLDQAKDLAGRIGVYARLKSSAGAAKDFETRAMSFGGVATSLRTAKASLERMQAAGIALDFIPNDAEALAAKAVTLRDSVKTDPATLNDPPFNLKFDFVDRINSLCSGARKAMLAAWQARVAQNSEMASPEILAALSTVPQYKPVVARIGVLKEQVAMLADSVPADISVGITQLKKIMDAYAAAWGEMTADGIPKAVIAFLRAAAGQGATLDQLTDEVRGWLDARSLLPLFRIKI